MTGYDPRQWTSHLLDIEGSMVREIMGRVFASFFWAVIVVLLYFFGPGFCRNFAIPATAHSLIGTALGLLLVFRTNSSYDRFWEGRKQWGGIVNECRNLTRQTSVWLAADQSLMREVISWTIAFPFAVMQRLHKTTSLGTTLSDVSSADLAQVEASKHAPLAVANLITERIFAAREKGLIDGSQLKSLDNNVELLIDYCGACERIHSTPMPFAYAVHLRRVLIVYCSTLPFALVKDFGWATIPATLLTTYILLGIEEIGVEIEDPFGFTSNDLPIQTYCQGIEAVLCDVRDTKVGPSENGNRPA
jgi:ion channel-forming bestrophin family protein